MTTNWTIVPVAKSSALARSTVQFSPSSLALQDFAATLQRVAPSKLSSHSRSGIEILVLDVLALELDTVFVNLDGELAQRLENGEGTFFREHPTVPTAFSKGKAVAAPAKPQDRLTTALRVALGTLQVVHAGDLFPLPLPPHPVTHVPPNPGKVSLCEPVAQGVLSARTRIVVSRGRAHSKAGREPATIPTNKRLNGVAEEGYDTANDQFFSAAEERAQTETDVATEDTDSITESESELSAVEQDELSDDSMDDMISLQTPTLPATNVSGISTMQAGTPMTLTRGRRTNGVATPGSVFSSFTATTARQDRPRGRLFKAQGLVRPIPSELLHPKPPPEDDEEARVYVDVSNLNRIGCFSGDWVRMETAEEPPMNGFGRFALGGFGEPAQDEPEWRPVRIFGLPEGHSQRPVTRISSSKHDGRKLSFFEAQMQKPSSPSAYVSPVLLANLEDTQYVRLSPLKRSPQHLKSGQAKSSNIGQPPLAQEVAIQQVRTPVAAERDFQTAILVGLKVHFEKKLRLIKTGDLIAIPIDAQLGRTLGEAAASTENTSIRDLLSLAASGGSGGQGRAFSA